MKPSNRVSQACNACRSKKRRCDGARPVCGLCSRLHVECQYKPFDPRWSHPPRSQPESPSDSAQPSKKLIPADAFSPPKLNPDRLSALRANSGALSADLVRQDLGSAHDRSTHTSPWNLGIRPQRDSCEARPIYDVISLAEFDKLAPVYFQKIHVLQGTFSEALFNRKKRARWDRKSGKDDNSECFDLLFATVGSLCALFSGGSPYEEALAECASLHLHQHMAIESLTAYDVDALLLRTLYLRMTAGPRASWVSSCMAVTALQDSLIRTRAGPNNGVLPNAVYELDHQDVPEEPNILHEKRYRLAKNMNDWISNEAGRPKAFPGSYPFRGVPISDMAVGPGWEMLTLAEMSRQLDPDEYDMDTEGLKKMMHEFCNFTSTHDFVQISLANLANTIFRRLRTLNTRLSTELISGLISLCCSGLESTIRLVEDAQPWHHCANFPFQALCTFLLLDTAESLSKVSHALTTIRRVCECFPTPTMQNTVQTATHLVDLARQRKQQDSAALSTAWPGFTPMNGQSSAGLSAIGTSVSPSVMGNNFSEAGSRGMQGMQGIELSPGLLEADFSSWDNIDWDQVLQNSAFLGPS